MATEQQLRDYLKRATADLTETRRQLVRAEERMTEPIAVIGMACRYPGGANTVEDYWNLLRGGGNAVSEVPPSRWNADDYYNPDRKAPGAVYTRQGAFLDDIAGWDAAFFGHSPQEALRLDPQQRLLAELVWEALENAGTPAPSLAGSRTGVLVGFLDFLQFGRLELERIPNVVSEPHFGPGIAPSVVSGRIAYLFDLRGPAITVDTACSSSLVAVHLAVEALRRDECDLAVAAGVSLVTHPDMHVLTCATSQLSADGSCKTFDSRADGYVMGEGGGVVVLERLSSAIRNRHWIRAVIRGSATNQDGRTNGLTAPSRAAQADVIRRALTTARVAPDDVDFVEAHGSGTRLGDAIELAALHDVFGGRPPQRPLRVGAVKTNIGHTLAASGMAGLIKTALCLENGAVPPNLHFAKPARAIPEDGTIAPVGSDPRHTGLAPRIAGVSAFGWSGSNAHVVLEAAPAIEPHGPDDVMATPARARVLVCSAATDGALRARLERLATHLADRPELDLADVAYTLRSGRAALEHRQAVVCADTADAVRALNAAATKAGVRRMAATPKIAFLLPGVGDQYPGLGNALYRTEPVYAEAADRCVELLDGLGVELRPLLLEPAGPPAGDLAGLFGHSGASADDPLNQAEIAHPFLFTVEYALAALLSSWGVQPGLLVGYSLGEYVAACLAGVFTLPDALRIVVERARLIAAVPPGRMVAVAASEDRVRAALPPGTEVGLAAINGPAMTVLSGPVDQVDPVAAALTAAGVACRTLRSAHAFHSSLLEPARDKLAALLESVPRHEPRVGIVSNRTGTTLTPGEATSARYWADHLVQPVRFADGIRHCLEQGVTVLVELGAGQTLGGLVRQNGVAAEALVLGTLPPLWTEGADARTELLNTCGRLWEAGVDVDWAATCRDRSRLVSLPTYPFQRTRFWPEPGHPGPAPRRRSAAPADLGFAPAWRRDSAAVAPRLDTLTALPGPLVVFADAGGVGERLAAAVAATGTTVLEVLPGKEIRRDERRLVIDPNRLADYREVFAACPGAGPLSVAHLWSLDIPVATPGIPADGELRQAIHHGFDSLLLAVRALGEQPGQREVRLLTASAGAVEILGGDALAPHRALAHGLGRAVRPEYPNLTWSGVDLDPEAEAPDSATHVAAELSAAPQQDDELEGLAGWRRGRRWLKGWGPIALTPARELESPWRPDGTYLITGGTRGLGMALAQHLVAAGVRRLALVGRTPLPRDLDLADQDNAAVRSLLDVAELEAAGVEVLLLSADAGVPAELRAALRRCREHFGALHGVIHAAGLPAGGLAQRRTVADAATVLAPKVLAMGPLAELVGPDTPEAERPELLVLYSSAVTAFGGIGEGDYCAANTLLDACGEALSARAPSTRVLSVAWGPWQHDTWQTRGLAGAANGLAKRVRAYRERWGFAADAGCAFLDRLITGGHGSVLAVRQPLRELLRDWSAMTDRTALAGAVAPSTRFPRPRLRTEFAPPRTVRETTIAEVWGAYLGIDQVGIHDPFFDLGGNSLLGLAMVLAIEREVGRPIPPAVLFEHPTVAAFAAALDGVSAASAGAGPAPAVGAARGQRRRQARNGAESENGT